MLVLLPPSEGKTAPSAGDPVDLDSLVFADRLSGLRAELLDAVDPGLLEAPAAPAAKVYSGVLYGHLGLSGLPAAARRRVLIASALWGFVRPDDRIPDYSFSAKTRLDGIGPPARWWREPLVEAVPDKAGELIVDMRSAAYAAAWQPQRATLLAVRGFRERGGERKAVTHMVKAIRGEVARALLLAKKAPATPEDAAAIASDAGFEVELGGASLDVIVPG